MTWISLIREQRDNANFTFLLELVEIRGYSCSDNFIAKLRYDICSNIPADIDTLYSHLSFLEMAKERALNGEIWRGDQCAPQTIAKNLSSAQNLRMFAYILLNYFMMYYPDEYRRELDILESLFSLEKYVTQVVRYSDGKCASISGVGCDGKCAGGNGKMKNMDQIINFTCRKLIVNGNVDAEIGEFGVLGDIFVPVVILAHANPPPSLVYLRDILASKNLIELVESVYNMRQCRISAQIPAQSAPSRSPKCGFNWKSVIHVLARHDFVPAISAAKTLATIRRFMSESIEEPDSAEAMLKMVPDVIRDAYDEEIEIFMRGLDEYKNAEEPIKRLIRDRIDAFAEDIYGIEIPASFPETVNLGKILADIKLLCKK